MPFTTVFTVYICPCSLKQSVENNKDGGAIPSGAKKNQVR